jgi:hypothetical protein
VASARGMVPPPQLSHTRATSSGCLLSQGWVWGVGEQEGRGGWGSFRSNMCYQPRHSEDRPFNRASQGTLGAAQRQGNVGAVVRLDWMRRCFRGAEEWVSDGCRCHAEVESNWVAAIPAALKGGEPMAAVLQMLGAIQGWRAGSSRGHRLSSESGAQGQGRETQRFFGNATIGWRFG